MGNILTEKRITRAICSKLPLVVTHDVKAGEEVLIFRGKKKQQIGTYKVNRVQEEMAFVTDNKTSRPFSVTQVLTYTGNKRDLELKHILKVLSEIQSYPEVNITEVFYPSDGRVKTEQCREAIKKENDGLLERGVFKLVKHKDIHNNANIITVLVVKDIGTPEEKLKARLAAHGQKDPDKHNHVQNCLTIRPISLRIILTPAAIKRLKLGMTDVIQILI